jgi:hypothetical protein
MAQAYHKGAQLSVAIPTHHEQAAAAAIARRLGALYFRRQNCAFFALFAA